MTREEKQKAIDALKISVPIMAITQEEFADYIQTLNKIMDWLEQEPCETQMIDKSNFSKEQYKADLQCAYDCGKASVKPCEDVPGINDGNIYECSCGYGWDKSKVVRHHFCPNCGKAVESSYNSIKTELKPCNDAISRNAAIVQLSHNKNGDDDCDVIIQKDIETIKALSPVIPQRKIGHWIIVDDCEKFIAKCSECSRIEDSRMISKYPYCHCGAKMEVVEE